MAAPSTPTGIEPPERLPRKLGYRLTTWALATLLAVTVVDGVTPLAILGVDSATRSASASGYDLEVTYGEVTRPALATPFDIRVRRDGGFEDDDTIRVGVDQEYLRLWDENGLVPAPADEVVVGDLVVWEFDPPSGDELLVTYDARIEPAAQEGRSGRVALLSEDDAVLVEVGFTTRVMP